MKPELARWIAKSVLTLMAAIGGAVAGVAITIFSLMNMAAFEKDPSAGGAYVGIAMLMAPGAALVGAIIAAFTTYKGIP